MHIKSPSKIEGKLGQASPSKTGKKKRFTSNVDKEVG